MDALDDEEWARRYGDASEADKPGPTSTARANSRGHPRFSVKDADEVSRPLQHWLTKNRLPAIGVGMLAGAPTAGKTFVAIDIASRVADGDDVWGERTRQSGVCYVAAEGAAGLLGRIEGKRSRHGRWNGFFRLITDTPNLTSEEDRTALTSQLRELAKEFASRGEKLGLVIIDTLSASTAGMDENSAKEVGPVLNYLSDLAAELSCFVLVVAHVGKDASRGVRGWSGILANVDAVIIVTGPDESGVRSGRFEKIKDGESGLMFHYELQKFPYGVDEHGDQVTTCHVEYCTPPKHATAGPRRSKIDMGCRQILAAFDDLYDGQNPVPLLPGVRPGTCGVRLPALRELVYQRGFHAEGGTADPSDLGASRRWIEARKKAFRRALEKLEEAGSLRTGNDYAWAPG